MTDEKRETIADIVAEMRVGIKDCDGEYIQEFDDFADRIEAAYNPPIPKDAEPFAHATIVLSDMPDGTVSLAYAVNSDNADFHRSCVIEEFARRLKEMAGSTKGRREMTNEIKPWAKLGTSDAPWDAPEDGMGGYDIRCDMGLNRNGCEYEGDDFIGHTERIQDATAIVALPDLYDAARDAYFALSLNCSREHQLEVIHRLNAALRKAAGSEARND